MPRVRSISNHPYNGKMRLVTEEYDALSDDDADLLVKLKRAVRVKEAKGSTPPTYNTREMQAAQPAAQSTAAPVMATRDLRPADKAPAAPAKKPSDKP